MVEEIWRTGPLTLREEVLDRDAMAGRLADAAPMERVWMLATLGRVAEASDEGEAVLREADSRFGPLLLLGYVRLHQFYWAGAARLQEEALQLARTPVREAGVRYQIGRRLFEEGRYLDSVREFGWACDLRRTHGCSDTLVTRSVRARDRAFTLFRRTGR